MQHLHVASSMWYCSVDKKAHVTVDKMELRGYGWKR